MRKIYIPKDEYLTGKHDMIYNNIGGTSYELPWDSTTEKQRKSWEHSGCVIIRLGHAYAPEIQTCSVFVPDYLKKNIIRGIDKKLIDKKRKKVKNKSKSKKKK